MATWPPSTFHELLQLGLEGAEGFAFLHQPSVHVSSVCRVAAVDWDANCLAVLSHFAPDAGQPVGIRIDACRAPNERAIVGQREERKQAITSLSV